MNALSLAVALAAHVGDLQPLQVLLIVLLVIPALVMPFTGGRAARRAEAWSRFDALARIRGVSSEDRGHMEAWARVSCARSPHLVLVRRKDFDRFARSEAQKFRGLPPDTYQPELERLAALREQLGFGLGSGGAQSTHDVVPGELIVLRQDGGEAVTLIVDGVDEEGLHVTLEGRAKVSLERIVAGWATFSRDSEGHYRFRTTPVRRGLLAHGDFLVHEERRRDLRVTVDADAFWVAVDRLPDGAAPEDPEGVQVEIVDLSVGGLALLADREVRRGSALWLDLPLGDGPSSPRVRALRAEVLNHGYREGGGRRPHFLHCRWIEMPDAPRKVIEGFVFSHLDPDDS
ncbi:MAG: PilZ domain-containing protein [Planctomycetes bacterium]|nr:PilZ domain-containing protein [Planctomycetota bacterium]